MTIINVHGIRAVPAYIKDGVAVARSGKRWSIHHAASGTVLYYGLERHLLKYAKEVAQQIIDLDVDWTRGASDDRFQQQLREASVSIRWIAECGPGYSGC